MLYPTHILFGALTVPIVDGFTKFHSDSVSMVVQTTCAILVGSGLPDIDSPNSYFGRLFPKLSDTINLKFGHRGFFHSYIFTGVVFLTLLLVAWSLSVLSINLFPFCVKTVWCVLMHEWLDSLNHQGVRLFNDENVYSFFENPTMAIRVGSRKEMKFQNVLLLCFLISLPFYFVPIGQALYYINENPGNALEIIKTKYEKHGAIIEMQGRWKETVSSVTKGGTFVFANVISIDSERNSLELKLKESNGVFWADIDGSNPNAALTITRIKNIRWIDAPLKTIQIRKEFDDLINSDFPMGSYITGRIMTSARDELQRLFEAKTTPNGSIHSRLYSKNNNKVVYELINFSAAELADLLPLYVDSANLNVTYRSHSHAFSSM